MGSPATVKLPMNFSMSSFWAMSSHQNSQSSAVCSVPLENLRPSLSVRVSAFPSLAYWKSCTTQGFRSVVPRFHSIAP